jgi:hypothetical protein
MYFGYMYLNENNNNDKDEKLRQPIKLYDIQLIEKQTIINKLNVDIYNLQKHKCEEKVVFSVRNVYVINIDYFVNKIIDNLPNHNTNPLPPPQPFLISSLKNVPQNIEPQSSSKLSLEDKVRLKLIFNSYLQEIDNLKSMIDKLVIENNHLKKNVPKSSLFDKLLVNRCQKLKNENNTLKEQLNDNNLPMLVVKTTILVPLEKQIFVPIIQIVEVEKIVIEDNIVENILVVENDLIREIPVDRIVYQDRGVKEYVPILRNKRTNKVKEHINIHLVH